jgi:hypothetical protein
MQKSNFYFTAQTRLRSKHTKYVCANVIHTVAFQKELFNEVIKMISQTSYILFYVLPRYTLKFLSSLDIPIWAQQTTVSPRSYPLYLIGTYYPIICLIMTCDWWMAYLGRRKFPVILIKMMILCGQKNISQYLWRIPIRQYQHFLKIFST